MSRAIILAAGRGSRLGDITRERPKALVELGGQPLIAWQLAALRAAGVHESAVVCGYRAADLDGYGETRFFNPRWAETNMVASLMCASSWLRAAACIISYSDIVYHPDHVARLLASEADIAISYDTEWLTLWSARFDDPCSDAETLRVDSHQRLLEIGHKTHDPTRIEGQYMGLLRITPGGWAKIEDHLGRASPGESDRMDMTSLLRRLVSEGTTIAAIPVAGRWLEVDSADDLALYQRQLSVAGADSWLRSLGQQLPLAR